MRTDEEGGRLGAGQRRLGMAANLRFYTADVGDDTAGRKVGRDAVSEVVDPRDGSGDHDQGSVGDGGFRRRGNFITPRLTGEFETNFRSASPDYNSSSGSASAGSLSNGASEQTRSQDNKCIDHSSGETPCTGGCRANGYRCQLRMAH